MSFSKHKRSLGVYVAGALFALAYWIFFDACILSAHARPPADAPYDTVPVHVTIADWTPGIFSTLGMLVVSLINKEQLLGEESLPGDSSVRRARIFLFVGLTMMAGGLAGSVAILILKYTMNGYGEVYNYYGYAGVAQNVSIMLSAVALWLAQHSQNEYEYNLVL